MIYILVYDIIDKAKFDGVEYWLNEIKKNKKEKMAILLVGTKVDLENEWQISFEEGKNFSDNNNLIFYESSAKNNINIDNIFNDLFYLFAKVPCQRYFLPINFKLSNKFLLI